MKIFLDLDGVLVGFIEGVAKLFEVDYEELTKKWSPGTYHMEHVLGVSKSEFYKKIDDAGEEFWLNLSPFHYSKDFYNYCAAIAPTYILTSSTQHPSCVAGKLGWLQKWLGKDFRNYILTPKKEMCAKPGHVLIDDYVPNVEKFIENGGHAILFPALHNPKHAEAHHCIEIVKKELEQHGSSK